LTENETADNSNTTYNNRRNIELRRAKVLELSSQGYN